MKCSYIPIPLATSPFSDTPIIADDVAIPSLAFAASLGLTRVSDNLRDVRYEEELQPPESYNEVIFQ